MEQVKSVVAYKAEEKEQEAEPIILRHWGWCTSTRLCGEAYGHPRFADGTFVYTSTVQFIDERLGIAKTLNTTYILRDKA